MFAKIFDTPSGQYLAFKDSNEEQFQIVCVMEHRGMTIKAKLGYDTGEDRDNSFNKIDQTLANNTAASILAMVS